MDVDSGRLMAVKLLRQTPNEVKREVEILSELVHVSRSTTGNLPLEAANLAYEPHTVEYIYAQNGFSGIEIFMALKDGTLESLMESHPPYRKIPEVAFEQMLRALDFLAVKNIIHRDIKPANILYLALPGNPEPPYRFQLGDFGLSNRLNDARTCAGTYLYMASEVYMNRKQTNAADIWSLFATMMWLLDANGFRHYSRSHHPHEEVWDTDQWAVQSTGRYLLHGKKATDRTCHGSTDAG